MKARLPLWLWLVLLAAGTLYSLTRVSVVSDMAAFLPRGRGWSRPCCWMRCVRAPPRA